MDNQGAGRDITVQDVREEKKPLTAKLCAEAKKKIEKQWSGPNFEQDMVVEFRPVPKTEPVAAEA